MSGDAAGARAGVRVGAGVHGGAGVGADVRTDDPVRDDGALLAAASLAHEIRNPLGAMRIFASILRSDLGGGAGREAPAETLAVLAGIEAGIESIERVIGNVLLFARGSRAKPVPVHVWSVLREQCALVAPRFGEGRLRAEFSGNPFVEADDQALRHVFGNLLANAADAAGPEGRVTVTCGDAPGGDGGIVVTVADDGPGVDPAVGENLFDPYVTTKSSGTGLGLALVRRLVADHGGAVTAKPGEGPPGRPGARFVVELPRGGPVAAKGRG